MHIYSKIFFTKKRAEKFIEQLKDQGISDIKLWQGKDGFGQDKYSVKWNMD